MKIINFILCDDIRSEVGNNKSLMGVYAKEVSFSVNADEACMAEGFFPWNDVGLLRIGRNIEECTEVQGHVSSEWC